MNSKKLLSMLLVSLGVFSLGLTSCGPETPSVEPSTPSEKPSEDTPSVTESVSASEQPDSESVSESEEPVSESASESVGPDSESSSEDPVVVDTSIKYDVVFNYDDPQSNLTVWTEEPIEKTIAPLTNNVSKQEGDMNRRTVPLTTEGLTLQGNGMYYFAIDANGYIIYASYGLGTGYGSPCDGYYHNQDAKDVFSAPYWSIHDEWNVWPNTTVIDGVQVDAWTLYDFLIPEGGFVVKGFYKEEGMVSLWNQLTGMSGCPTGNGYLESTTNPKALDNWYFFLDADHKLSVRERTEADDATPAKQFTPTEADNPIAYAALVDVKELADNTTVDNVKGVITYKNGAEAVIVDEAGTAILLYDNQLKEIEIGTTIAFSATKITYSGDVELKSLTNLEVLTKYGSVAKPAPTTLTAANIAEAWVKGNNYKTFLLKGAVVKSLNETVGKNFKAVVTLGETDIDLFKATLPDTVAVGDTVDVLCTMVCYNDDVQAKLSSTDDVTRYYNITVDVDGSGAVEATTTAYPAGTKVTLKAENADDNYQFAGWEKLSADADGNPVWVLVENSETTPSLAIEVGTADESYRAVFTYSAWSKLPVSYAEIMTSPVAKVNQTAGENEAAVLTDAVIPGSWLNSDAGIDARWKTVIAVDAEGKIAYFVYNPANGFGGPSGTSYYVHPDYKDAGLENPAFNILEGFGPWVSGGTAHTLFEIKAPEGGFVLVISGDLTNTLLTKLTHGQFTFADDTNRGQVNSRTLPLDENARLFYNAANDEVKVFNNILTEGQVSLLDDASVVRHAAGTEIFDGTAWLNGVWANYMIVDADGVIAYNVWNVGCGYGGVGGFYANPKYAEENPCLVDGKIVVPEGFTGFKFGYGEYLDSLYGGLTHGLVTHTELDKNGYGALAYNWNSLGNSYLSPKARVQVKDGFLVLDPGEGIELTDDGTVHHAAGTEIFNGESWVNGVWANYMIVDANGVIAYNVWNVGCGYGDVGGFYANPIYAENNPCLVDGKIVVPEGFTGLKFGYGAYLDTLYGALTHGLVTHTELDKDGYSALAHNWNSLANSYLADDARVFVKDGSLVLYAGSFAEIEDNATVRHAAGTEIFNGESWVNGVWANYMIVDPNGVIAYNVWNVGCGYGDVGGFYANPIYAENNPCLVDGKIVVPEGFTGLKFGYGEYLDSVYGALSNGVVTHTELDKDGYSALAHNWNSLANTNIAETARVFVKDGSLVINPGRKVEAPAEEETPAEEA